MRLLPGSGKAKQKHTLPLPLYISMRVHFRICKLLSDAKILINFRKPISIRKKLKYG